MRVETDALKALANKKAASADLLLCKTPGKKRASGKALFPKGVFFLRIFAQFCACALAQSCALSGSHRAVTIPTA